MTTEDYIYREIQRLPAQLKQEVADFIGYLETKHGLSDEAVTAAKTAQEQVMESVWDNDEDAVWDDW